MTHHNAGALVTAYSALTTFRPGQHAAFNASLYSVVQPLCTRCKVGLATTEVGEQVNCFLKGKYWR